MLVSKNDFCCCKLHKILLGLQLLIMVGLSAGAAPKCIWKNVYAFLNITVNII